MAKEKKKWIQKMHLKKGALRSELGVKVGQNIPGIKLEKAEKSKNPLEKKRAVLAATFERIRKHL